ncbi:MAG TPA: tetratricopeptide repeat protein [Nitrospira sp.]|nr:tetratricopeptide repeat protein [Nitrospira sp.]
MRPFLVILVLMPCLSAALTEAEIVEEQRATPPIIESPPPTTQPLEREPLIPVDDMRQESLDAVLAVAERRAAVRMFPDHADNRLKLAQALYGLGEFDGAIEECRAAIKLQPNSAQAHLQLGMMLIAKQDWRAAASVLKEAVRLDPNLAHAYYGLGGAQYSVGDVKGAVLSYRRALELQPDFPDTRYRLALLLKLTGRNQEAAQLMEEAAVAGVAQARLFLANAYKNGQGVDRNLSLAIFWWNEAAELGQQAAADALSKLRRQALSSNQHEGKKAEVRRAFDAYREKLWDEFPEYAAEQDSASLGIVLRRHNHAEAIPVLLRECYALSGEAQAELALLYQAGWDGRVAPFDKHILGCFETTAAEGFPPAKKILARIYAGGIGLEADPSKAKSLLKGLPKQDRQSLQEELNLP